MNSSMNSPERIIYKVRITPAAEQDLKEIYLYIKKDNPRTATKFFNALRQKTQSLKWSPQRCAKISEKFESPYQYRHLIFKRYRIIFYIAGDTVWVMRIVHGARQLDLTTLLYFMLSSR